MPTYDIKVKVKTAEGNTATRTLISGVNGVNTEALKNLVEKYQKISTDKVDTSTGKAEVTIVENTDYLIENFAGEFGHDYLSSEDVLSIQGTLGLNQKTVRITASATYDTISGATYDRDDYIIDVKAYAQALNSATNYEWTPVTANLSRTQKDSFSADPD